MPTAAPAGISPAASSADITLPANALDPIRSTIPKLCHDGAHGWSFEPGGRGGGFDGEPGQARVLGAVGQREIVVRVDLDHLRVQRLGQLPLLGRAAQAGRGW